MPTTPAAPAPRARRHLNTAVAALDLETVAYLCANPSRVLKNVAVKHGAAALWVSSDGERYVMSGPSGLHTLAVVATDLPRLNAHWQGFAADTRNAGYEARRDAMMERA